MVRTLLRLEGFAFFVTALFVYHYLQGNWILFIVLLLLPDIFMLGYIKDKKIGAVVYNIGHTYLLGLVIFALGLVFSDETAVLLGIIFFAHVGMDRMVGFGLKYKSSFKDTHLQKV